MNLVSNSHDTLLRLVLLPLFCFSLFLISGCGGCTPDDPETIAKKKEEEERRKKEQEKPNFENKPPVIFPGNYVNEQRSNKTKRGHWITADVRMIANKFNAQGELHADTWNTKERRAGRVPPTRRSLSEHHTTRLGPVGSSRRDRGGDLPTDWH